VRRRGLAISATRLQRRGKRVRLSLWLHIQVLLQQCSAGLELVQGRIFMAPTGVNSHQCPMGRLCGRIRGKHPFSEPLAGCFIRSSSFSQRKAQSFHQLQRFLPVSYLMRAEPFVQTVGYGFARKHIAAVEVGGEGEVRRAAFGELALEEPNICFVRTGRQRDRFMIPLDGNGRVAAGGKPSPDVSQGLAQTVTRLRLASPWPKSFGKSFAMVPAATRQDEGGKKKRRLARCEADRLTLRGSHFETAKQPDAHAASPNLECAGTIASSRG
jgi:hypothetical protein